MDKKKFKSTALNGLVNNPTFVLVLGMCPTIAVSKTLTGALGMGLATTAVLILTNTLIAACRKLISDKVRIPCYILIIATMVTIVDMSIERFLPDLYAILGLFIPLIVVNCIIFARAESFASCNPVGYAALDGLSMGLGFTLSLSVLGAVRELLSYGGLAFTFGAAERAREVMPIFQTPVGGFIMLAVLMAAFNAVYKAVKRAAIDRQNELMRGADPRPDKANKGVAA
ncbi:MAG: electron transport complex subunit E [Clostridiales bacterium]|jgi:electron transport complex protein RnfE|nr:electron transport complex subunit E [Clostridiales bacterium]